MRARGAALALAAAVWLGACSNGGDNNKLTPDANDASPPVITLGANQTTRGDFEITDVDATARIPRGKVVVVTARARDPESGVKEVKLEGTGIATCLDATDPSAAEKPVAVEASTAKQEGGPSSDVNSNLTAYLNVDYAKLKAACSGSMRVRVLVTATAVNFATPAGSATSRTLTLTTDTAPDDVRVATFNLEGKVPSRADYGRWGRTLLSRVDIAFLQEVDRPADIDQLGQGNDLRYTAAGGNNLIMSRFPIASQQLHSYKHRINGRTDTVSHITEAVIDLGEWTLRVYNNHWPHWTENQPDAIPGQAAARDKLLAAAIPHSGEPMIAAGDFNTESYQGIMAGLRPMFKDSLAFFDPAPEEPEIAATLHCKGERPDQVVLHSLTMPPRGPGMAASQETFPYDGCWLPDDNPSKHPFLFVVVRRA